MKGYYYLHSNGELIWKKYLDDGQEADFRESPFVVMYWPVDMADRSTIWEFLVQASCCENVREGRIEELKQKWEIDTEDGHNYAEYLKDYVKLDMDTDAYFVKGNGFVDLQESNNYGHGPTVFEAFVGYCKALGYKPQKMWGKSFHDLVKIGAK